MALRLVLLFVAAAYSNPIQPGLLPGFAPGFPVAPQASGYIYRSDNDGPASLIQLGAHAYQPQGFAPIQLAQQPLFTGIETLQPVNSYGVVQPVLSEPIVVAEEIVGDSEEDDDESDEDDSSEGHDYAGDFNHGYGVGFEHGDLGHHGHHGHSFEHGGGNDYNDAHHASHGGKGSKGYNSKHYHDLGESSDHNNEGHKGFYEEGAGEKESHFDEADNHGEHHEAAKGYSGEDHGEKHSHSKGEKTDGFHKVYHKDEYKKDTDFYDESDNSGHFNKHGYYNQKHGSAAGGHKKGGKYDAGHEEKAYGKHGHHANGHHDSGDHGHSAENGGESYHNHHEDYANKGGDEHGKQYGYEH